MRLRRVEDTFAMKWREHAIFKRPLSYWRDFCHLEKTMLYFSHIVEIPPIWEKKPCNINGTHRTLKRSRTCWKENAILKRRYNIKDSSTIEKRLFTVLNRPQPYWRDIFVFESPRHISRKPGYMEETISYFKYAAMLKRTHHLKRPLQ